MSVAPITRLIAIVLALIGCAVAGYLTYVHYFGLQLICLGGGRGCETVQASKYAKLAGVPVAVIGLTGYIALLAAFIPRRVADSENGRLGAVLITAVGAAFSAYLTYLEIHVIHAICWWCVSSAVLMVSLLAVSSVRWLHGTPDARP